MRTGTLAVTVALSVSSLPPASAQSPAGAAVPGVIATAPTVVEDNTSRNTSVGAGALSPGTTGTDNTASGWQTLAVNTTGIENTANGSGALTSNTSGSRNTAVGTRALWGNVGGDNSAVGVEALKYNLLGRWNTALGAEALYWSVSNANTAVGFGALRYLAQGGGANTAIGYQAGGLLDEGTNNVYVGAYSTGTGIEHFTLRLGAPYTGGGGQNRAFIAGVHGTTLTAPATPVYIDANGQLGTQAPTIPPGGWIGGAASLGRASGVSHEMQDRVVALERLVEEQRTTIADQAAALAAIRAQLTALERTITGRR